MQIKFTVDTFPEYTSREKETKKNPSENDRSLLRPIMSDLECDLKILYEVTNEHKMSAES